MIKLLAVGDAGYPTGWERVMTKVLTHLDNTDDFDITVRGCGYTADAPYSYPWPVYPVTTRVDDLYGLDQMPEYVKLHKPDMLFLVQDLWGSQQYAMRTPPELPTVAYTPVDCPVMKWSYALTTGALAATVAYTPFGQREIAAGVQDGIDCMLEGQELFNIDPTIRRSWLTLPKDDLRFHTRLDRLARTQNLNGIDVIPHGRADDTFQPMDRGDAREAYGLPRDAFVVTNINANQFRKRQDLTLRAWKHFVDHSAPAQGRAYLILHSAGGARHLGWDLPQLIRLYGLTQSVIVVDQHKQALTEEELVLLYNTADANINTSGGEGWGLTIHESAACGVAQLVPDWSVTRDHWQGAGILLPLASWRHEPKMLNTAHCEIDTRQAGTHIANLYTHRELAREIGVQCRARSQRFETWAEILPRFEAIFRRAQAEPAEATPLSFNEIMALRERRITSSLRDEPTF